MFGVVGEPHFDDCRGCSQIVDMPANRLLDAAVALYPRSDAARTESTAHVDVIALLECGCSQASDFDAAFGRTKKDQSVGAGLGFHATLKRCHVALFVDKGVPTLLEAAMFRTCRLH